LLRRQRSRILAPPSPVADIVLVSMPFGPVFAPSLGLSLLKAGLARQGIEASLHYFTIRFAEAIGQDFYCGIAEKGSPTLEDLPGEWLFSRALFDTTPADDARYTKELLYDYYSDALIARLGRARELVDAFLDQCLAAILREEPALVGFTSIFQQHTASLALARRLKRARPSVFIVFGGANCEGVMGAETVRSFPFVDATISGEADLVFPELAKRVLHGEPVTSLQGVRSRASVEAEFATGRFTNAPMVTDMDCLPYPDYTDYFAQFRASRYDRDWNARVFLETARGCWWGERMHCTFCGLNGGTMRFRSKSAARALAEIADLAKRYPGCDIQTVDNILDMRYFKDVIPALAANPVKVGMFWETKSNLNKPQVRLLRDAGIREIQPGIESLSDAVLKLMRKGVTGLQNIQLLKWCRELGVDAEWNFLWGFPGEPPDEYARLAHVAPLLTHLQPPGTYDTIRMDRFSPNYFDAERLGFTDIRPLAAYQHVYRLPQAAIANLASFFTYRYHDPRNVEQYVRPLERQLAKWQRLKDRAALLSVDAGEHLVLIDLRPVRQDPFVVLGGLARALYLECDRVRDIWQLEQSITAAHDSPPAAGGVEALLAPLVQRGFVLRDGSRYLSLAVSMSEYVPPSGVVREFAATVRTLGTPAGPGWIVQATHIGTPAQGSSMEQGASARRAAGRRRARQVPVPRLPLSRFSIDARGRLVIQASERPRQRRHS